MFTSSILLWTSFFFNTWDFVEDGHGIVLAQGNMSHEINRFCAAHGVFTQSVGYLGR